MWIGEIMGQRGPIGPYKLLPLFRESGASQRPSQTRGRSTVANELGITLISPEDRRDQIGDIDTLEKRGLLKIGGNIPGKF